MIRVLPPFALFKGSLGAVSQALLACMLFASCATAPAKPGLDWLVQQDGSGPVAAELRRGASAEGALSNVYSPLMMAAALGKADVIRMLLDSGANLARRNPHGATALHFAVLKDHGSVVDTLLRRGADAAATSDSIPSPLELARFLDRPKSLDVFRKAGLMPGRSRTDTVRALPAILFVSQAYGIHLRVIYNRFLLERPHFKGKLKFKVAVVPEGTLGEVTLVESSTAFPAFDEAVLKEITTWTFGPVKSKHLDWITIPFSFSE